MILLDKMTPNVLVVGSGGVGAIAALSLTLNGKCDATLVVRSDYDQVVECGYTIMSVTYGDFNGWRPTNVARSVEEAAEKYGPFDFLVLTTKNIPDGPITCEEIIRPAVTDGLTTIVLIENGIGIEKPMIELFPKCVILSAVSLIGSVNVNCVVSNLHKDIIYLAPFDNPNVEAQVCKEKTAHFASIYQNEDPRVNSVIVEERASRSRWDKLVNNSVLNQITAITGLDVNRCQINGANASLFGPAMDEVYAIAASEGVAIDPATKNKFLHVADGSFFASSMLVDLKKSQLMEMEVILGNPLRIAARNGVKTPILSTIYEILKMVQFRTKEHNGLIKINESEYQGRSSDDYPEIFENSNNP